MLSANQEAFAKKLAGYREIIDKSLADYFNSDEPRLGLQLEVNELIALEKLQQFSLRPGKRIRGSLAMFSYEEFGGKKTSSAIKLALALELIQNYLLIIDDVMDRSSSRRGLPALHKIFEQDEDTDTHISQMMAIDVAMLAQHMASVLLTQIEEDAEDIRQTTAAFHKNITATGYGQFDDLLNTGLGKLDEAQLIRLYELKASYYTFINPLQTGALLAGHSEQELLNHIEKIGLPAGVAFQLQDDILGIFGAEKQTGKSTLDDLREGKITLLMLYVFEKATDPQNAKLKTALGNKKLSVAEHQAVQSIIEECGARRAVEQKIAHYAQLAEKQIQDSKFFSEEAKNFLFSMIEYATNRTV